MALPLVVRYDFGESVVPAMGNLNFAPDELRLASVQADSSKAVNESVRPH